MIKLSVNVNKIATLRNSRGGFHPSPKEFAQMAIEAGAHGITVHPRPDERHITKQDALGLPEIARAGGVEYNIEGYPDERYLQIIRDTGPDQATLVPDPPDALTSNAGWNAVEHQAYLREVVAKLKDHCGRVSLFLEPDEEQVKAAKETGADRIEFYTEPFATAFDEGRGRESFEVFAKAARLAQSLGLGINAGHDLNLRNMTLMRELPGLDEVSIGHALVIDALRRGWKRTIQDYLRVIQGGEPPQD